MERIGVRELRQHASRWLARVEDGEAFEVTDRGRPVARLVPIVDGGTWERMLADGRLTAASGAERPAPTEGAGDVGSPELERLRFDER